MTRVSKKAVLSRISCVRVQGLRVRVEGLVATGEGRRRGLFGRLALLVDDGALLFAVVAAVEEAAAVFEVGAGPPPRAAVRRAKGSFCWICGCCCCCCCWVGRALGEVLLSREDPQPF